MFEESRIWPFGNTSRDTHQALCPTFRKDDISNAKITISKDRLKPKFLVPAVSIYRTIKDEIKGDQRSLCLRIIRKSER
jgi:hypothetical protein